MAKKFEKRALLTGVGELYLQFMETEDTPDTAPTYATDVLVTPSIDKVDAKMELSEKKVYLSNLLHSDFSGVKNIGITLDAGYLPEGFAEEAQGKVKIGDTWATTTNPRKKMFRMAIPFTDENGDELIINYPKCTLSPVDAGGETQKDDINEQIRQYNIVAQPLTKKSDGANIVYVEVDMSIEANKKKYDRDKLLENGWFDTASLKKCEAGSSSI